MALTNQDRVTKGLDLLRLGLGPFVERELNTAVKAGSLSKQAIGYLTDDPKLKNRPIDEWDSQALLKAMWDTWNDVSARILGQTERSLVQEVRNWRNKWAHQEPLTSDDTDRALDSMARLLTAVSAPQAEELGKMKQELRRLIYEEQVRGEKRKAGGSLIEGLTSGNLKPWREIVTPHPDVASGRYQQAEFAADLWQVHLGDGSDEYRKPEEFFRRTYLTESLKRLLVGGAQRLSGTG
ncbi:MAG: AAA+ family ATPase, partial [Calditrichaeota bacterium]|nr:AAA+ family ATPase [Calditrichota bacterium]